LTDNSIIRAQQRYANALHAVQSGVKTEMEIPPASGGEPGHSPKHLRVGVNSAKVEHGALVKLLVDRGLFTELEHMEAMATAMEEEKERYEKRLSEYFGSKVTLA
jgi:hypothetical protein